jgi:pimeloyl-ACP methyl ester carboxylesterase
MIGIKNRRYFDIGGVRVVVRVEGSGPPLILLHGLGCSGRYMRPLRRLLAPTFTVITPDLPGHGGSEKPPVTMWHLSELTDWVAQMIVDFGLDHPLVAGHSLGGGIAVDLAARYPHLVGGIVLLAPTGVPDVMPPLLKQFGLLTIDAFREPLRLYPLLIPAYLIAGPQRILRLAVDQTRYSQREALHAIDTPMLVMRGGRDPVVRHTNIDDLLAEAPDSQYVEVAGAAHALNVSHPEAVAEAIHVWRQSHVMRET